MVELGKTHASRRQVPLSQRALPARDDQQPRLDTPVLFTGQRGGVLNLDNWRRREWAPAIEAAGIRTPARIYDLRSTFASDALAAGASIRARADHGHERAHDRAPLRHAARRCGGRFRREA